jgi:hypothetical protein
LACLLIFGAQMYRLSSEIRACSFSSDWHSYEAEALASNYRASENCYGLTENVSVVPRRSATPPMCWKPSSIISAIRRSKVRRRPPSRPMRCR